jgi:predicted DNA-binding transcriptional regulator YafY
MSIQLLSKAIEDRMVVLFRHEGRQYAVEPYSVGYNKPLVMTAGPLILRGWCLSANAWCDFKVKHMSRLDVSNDRFTGDRLGHIDLLWVHRDIWGRRDSQRSN